VVHINDIVALILRLIMRIIGLHLCLFHCIHFAIFECVFVTGTVTVLGQPSPSICEDTNF